jgi:hypothetical protein
VILFHDHQDFAQLTEAPAGLEAELAADLGAGAVGAGARVAGPGAVVAGPGAAVAGAEEQPATRAPPTSIVVARTARSWYGPVSDLRPENIPPWLLMSPSLTAAAIRRLRQST